MSESRKTLVNAALGRIPPDLVIAGGNVVNVYTREVYASDVIVKGQRIAAVTDGQYEVGDETRVVRADGQYLVPGFIDPHMHLESSCVTATEFAKAILPRGVTTVAWDAHDLASILGFRGIALLFDEARNLPLKIFLRVPARVPQSEDLETSGAALTLEETKQMLHWEAAVSLAGDLPSHLVLECDEDYLNKIAYAIELGKTVNGASHLLWGRELDAFVAAGIEDTHIPKDTDELIEDVRHGLHVLLTPRTTKFGPSEFGRFARLLGGQNLDTRNVSFCTDDVWPHELETQGHLDHRVRLAISQGIDPMVAIQMATLNTAQLLRLERDLGSISAGKIADIAVVDDLRSVCADKVVARGALVAEGGKMVLDLPQFTYPDWSKATVRLARRVVAEDFQIRVEAKHGEAKARVMVNAYPRECAVETLAVREGVVLPDTSRDILGIAVVERHKRTGNIGKAFAKGFGVQEGAVAASIEHNAGNIVVIGTGCNDMAVAVNRLADIGGGYVAAKGGKVVGEIPLPIAGMLSSQPYAVVAQEFVAFDRVLKEELGCRIDRPLWTLVFFCIPSGPHVGLTDRGLVNTDTMTFQDVIVA